ncbi:hypothetical protein C9382_04570 [Pseudomonas aylmerensis]|uniref:Uncharacterized protein n=1 Tax=Pseudomonas aylmerensis TaxID=1869229 RepID=A0A2T4G8Z3_9PSED|nr:hypothetical protein BBG20_26115 [Pseudomonas aylmerensis]PTC32144.1 hypothetical protein C9382_04570 [Pseudomonas aylmerensis]
MRLLFLGFSSPVARLIATQRKVAQERLKQKPGSVAGNFRRTAWSVVNVSSEIFALLQLQNVPNGLRTLPSNLMYSSIR